MDELSACSSAEPFALRVIGDSMEPEFKDGAIIIVDPAGVIEDGCYVIAQVGTEYVFRQLRIRDGLYSLFVLNGDITPVTLAGINDIHGVVIQQAGRRRHQRKSYI